MNGKLFINGTDIFQTYKGFVVENGHSELIEYPAMKNIETNNWHEENGIEVDLSDPKLDSKSFSLNMAFVGTRQQFYDFISFITVTAYNTWNFAEISRSYNLRLVNNNSFQKEQDLRVVKFTLANDAPLSGYSYIAPSGGFNTYVADYELDAVQLSQYGVQVLKGALAELEKVPTVKTNLLRTNSKMAGSVYDGGYVKFKEKEATINCLMRASDLGVLWRNWDALLYDLSKPNIRTFHSVERNEEFPCYYKNSKVEEFSPLGEPWVKFKITLIFIFIVLEGEEWVLSSENDYIIITEDGEFAIDMKPN